MILPCLKLIVNTVIPRPLVKLFRLISAALGKYISKPISYSQAVSSKKCFEMPPTSKQQGSQSADAMENRNKQNKIHYSPGENISRISPAEVEKTKSYENRVRELKNLLSIRQYADKDLVNYRRPSLF